LNRRHALPSEGKAFRAVRGFSLIELMIVVSIIAILSAIAVNSYIKYAQSSRRSDAYAALSQDQGILERCYALTFNYANASNGSTQCAQVLTVSPSQYYDVAVTFPAGSTTSYLLTATPVASGPQEADTTCPSFSIDNTNTKTPSPTTSTCWQQ
jgi:type IV pilus assembly protein PilE